MENKGIATEHKSGIFGHLVRKYDEYIEAYYLEKYNSTREKVFYKKIMKKLLVNSCLYICSMLKGMYCVINQNPDQLKI